MVNKRDTLATALRNTRLLLSHRGEQQAEQLLVNAHMDVWADLLWELTQVVIYLPVTAYEALKGAGGMVNVGPGYGVINPPDSYYVEPFDHTLAIEQALRDIWHSTGLSAAVEIYAWRIDVDSLQDKPLTLSNASTGWDGVDRLMERIIEEFQHKEPSEIGNLCRQTLDLLANQVAPYGKPLEKLETYFSENCPADSSGRLRKCVRSAHQLASELVHRPNATRTDAKLCAHATFQAVQFASIIQGG